MKINLEFLYETFVKKKTPEIKEIELKHFFLDFIKLPLDIQKYILSYLSSPSELCKIASTSKDIQKVSEHNLLWDRFLNQDYPDMKNYIEILKKTGESSKSIYEGLYNLAKLIKPKLVSASGFDCDKISADKLIQELTDSEINFPVGFINRDIDIGKSTYEVDLKKWVSKQNVYKTPHPFFKHSTIKTEQNCKGNVLPYFKDKDNDDEDIRKALEVYRK